MGRKFPLPALLVVLLLPILARGGSTPESAMKTVTAKVRGELSGLHLKEKDLRTRHDFIPADAWRMPLVDAWLEKPLGVPGDAWRRFGPWLGAPGSLESLLRRAARTLGTGPGGEAPGKPAGLVAELLALWPAAAPGRPDPGSLGKELAVVPKPARDYLAELVHAVGHAVRERTAAFKKLSESEWVYLRQYGSQFSTGMPATMQTPLLRSYHARIDIPRIVRASFPVAAVLDRLGDLQSALEPPRSGGEFHLVFETPAGRVEIGGFGRDRYEKDCLLTFDLGGDDVYANSAGGTLYTPRKISVCVDLAGDDLYRTTVGLGQGSGMYGVGMLVDAAGDDAYDTKNVSQGAGHAGVGVLWDMDGDDRYTARSVSQGAGFQGIGLLRDDAGRDVYRLGMQGQGYAGPQGFGILLDAKGNDSYAAGGLTHDEPREPDRYISMAQGVGFGIRADRPDLYVSGGIGLLADLSGNDLYEADVFGQGCAYWYAVGILLDGGGRDFYHVHNYGEGAGIHMGVGILLDRSGNDRYQGDGHALGHALDRGFGFFLDFAGDDLYESRDGESQGAAVKPFAVGLFADLAGDDIYRGGGNGYVRVPGQDYEGEWPKAFFLDLGGRDRYEAKDTEAANGKKWTKNRYGRGLDR